MSQKKIPKAHLKLASGHRPLSIQQKIKIGVLLVALVALGALAWSYFTQKSAETCLEEWGKLKVQVNDNYGDAVRNANVSVWWNGTLMRSGLTDWKGSIAFPHLYYDWYNVTVTKMGLNSAYQLLEFDRSQSDVKQMFTLWHLNFSLTLNVTDSETGCGVPNASVQVYRYDYHDNYQAFYTMTNTSGIAIFAGLEHDEYAIVVTHAAYYNYSALTFIDEELTLMIGLQRIPEPPEPEPEPEPEPSDDTGNLNLAIGIAIGFIVCTAAFWFFLLQRRLREAERKGGERKW